MDFQTRVFDIMTDDLTTVNPEDKVEKLKKLFERRSFHHLPVEDKQGNLLGIVSTEDINKFDQYRIVPELLVKHIMTSNPIIIEEDKTLESAIKLFLEKGFRALPVVNKKGKFIGLITVHDLVKEMYRSACQEEELKDTEDYV